MTTTIPAASADTTKIEQLLDALGVGDMLAYATINAAIGRNVQSCMHLLARARMRLLNKHKVFACVANTGVQRLSDSEMVEAGRLTTAGIRRKARNGARILTSVSDFGALPDAIKMRHNVDLALFGVIDTLIRPSGQKRLQAVVQTPTMLSSEGVRAIADTIIK